MKTKDEREWDVLDSVFELDEKIVDVVKSEQPDFILDYQGTKTGVEITELYYNDSMARFHNQKNYLGDILLNNKIHKDDRTILKPMDIIYYGKSNGYIPFETKMLPKPKYNLDDFRKSFSLSLEKKEVSKIKYNQELEQCSLIIFDKEDAFKEIDADNFHASFIDDGIFNSVISSSFDEIFLLVQLKNNQMGFTQLKLACLLFEINRLFDYIAENQDKFNNEILSKATHQIVFAEVLLRRNIENIFIFNIYEKFVTSTQQYGIGFTHDPNNTNKISIFDHFPRLYKESTPVTLESLPYNLFDDDTFKHYCEEVKNKRMSCGIPFLNKKYGYQFKP
ncbi:hypothetical protein ACLI07_12395 [Providencia huaxiensis]|uniref:hypothetical protein n=1 Tax=Providencia TaxID=586 RepID=UPI0018E85088|nr:MULTISPECIES: hypothetical protein [Providencia]QQE95080.1 hypothetical protein JFB93_09805 [Providencia rettgeri]QWJ93547.1 hypothetical protein KM147_09875 [Providencia rettgeri]